MTPADIQQIKGLLINALCVFELKVVDLGIYIN